MAGPPKDVEPSALWKKLKEAPRPSEVVDFPRYENGKAIDRIRLQVLTIDDHDTARQEALRKLKKRGFTDKEIDTTPVGEIYADLCAREALALASLGVKPIPGSDAIGHPVYPRLFRDGDDLNVLTADELHVLWTAYRALQHKYGPCEDTINGPEEVTDWIKTLAEGGRTDPFLRLNWPASLELSACLVRRAYILSSILASQWESLPDSLKSNPELSSMGIGSSTWRPVTSTDTGLKITSDAEEFEEGDIHDWSHLFVNEDGNSLTTEEAQALSVALRG